jgi:hypothetical protein
MKVNKASQHQHNQHRNFFVDEVENPLNALNEKTTPGQPNTESHEVKDPKYRHKKNYNPM